MDYWEECISEAFEDAGIKASKAQIDVVAGWVEGAHENYGMAHGYDEIPNPLVLENERLKSDLMAERAKTECSQCDGKGWITTHGPIHSATSECMRCRGEGRI